jgi:hypothetical protein
MLHGFGMKPFTACIVGGESGFGSASGWVRKGDVVTMEQTSETPTQPSGGLFPTVITARIERDGAIFVAVRGAISPGQIANRVSHVGFRIEQAFGSAAISQCACGSQPDLHQAVIAAVDGAFIVATLAHDHAMNERRWYAVGSGKERNHQPVFFSLLAYSRRRIR